MRSKSISFLLKRLKFCHFQKTIGKPLLPSIFKKVIIRLLLFQVNLSRQQNEYRGGQYCRKFFGKKIRQYAPPSFLLGAYIKGIIIAKNGDFAKVKFGNIASYSTINFDL
jgi:hypothetical protein